MRSEDSAIKTLVGELDFDPAELKRKYLSERDKRIREDGNDQYIEVTAEFSRYVDDPYVETPITRDPLTDEVFTVVSTMSGEVIGMAVPQPVLMGYALFHIAWHDQ